MPSEREKMLAGELYDPKDPELVAARLRARRLCREFNQSDPADEELRRRVLSTLLARGGDTATIEPPFHCDYGANVRLGEGTFFNFGCVILDVCDVTIGDRCQFGPGVQFYAATHPLNAELRRQVEFGKPVVIGDDVWIGGGAIVCPGVTIGDRAVIGAGSVVTRDVPPGVLAVGNPCRVVREITE